MKKLSQLFNKKSALEFKNYFFDEILSLAVGWIAGLLSVNILTFFIEKRSWLNLWGILSNKVVVEDNTYTISVWIVTAIIGFIVMKLVTRFTRLLLNDQESEKEASHFTE